MRNRKSRYIDMARQAARKAGVPERLFLSMIEHESGWNPSAVSSAGAAGLAQFMPGTAAGLGIDPFNPKQSLFAGAQYLADKKAEFGNWRDALRAYNYGSAGARQDPSNGQEYALAVLRGRENYKRAGATPSKVGSLPPIPGIPQTGESNREIWNLLYPDDPQFAGLLTKIEENRIGGPVRPYESPDDIPGQRGSKYRYVGRTFQLGTSWQGTHITDGLDWNDGAETAIDIMGKAGTPVGAPEAGVVLEWSPTGAQGGGRLVFRANSGALYWIGHIDNGLAPGTRVRRGQPLAVISSDHAAPHVHIDKKR